MTGEIATALRLSASIYKQMFRAGVSVIPDRAPTAGKAAQTGWGHKNPDGTVEVTLPSAYCLIRHGLTVTELIELRQEKDPLTYQAHFQLWLASEESLIYQALYGLHREDWICPSTGLDSYAFLSSHLSLWQRDDCKPRWLQCREVVQRLDSLLVLDVESLETSSKPNSD